MTNPPVRRRRWLILAFAALVAAPWTLRRWEVAQIIARNAWIQRVRDAGIVAEVCDLGVHPRFFENIPVIRDLFHRRVPKASLFSDDEARHFAKVIVECPRETIIRTEGVSVRERANLERQFPHAEFWTDRSK